MINPDSKKKPVFLYSYELSKLKPEVRNWLLSEAAAGRLEIAIIERSSMNDGQYEGMMVDVPMSSSSSPDGDDFWKSYEDSNDSRVALSRPLQKRYRGEVSEQEFVAKWGFWSPGNLDP